MNWQRVFAMVDRYNLYLKHNLDRLTDMFYWPALDLFIWGLTGLYLATFNPNSQQYVFIILNGLVFWIVIWRVQYEININILAELWDKNVVNIFASPLTVWEWIASLVTVGMMKMTVSLVFSCIIAFFVYHYNVFQYGFYLLPAILNLLLTGWAAGFLVAGLIIRFGEKIQTLAWAGVAMLTPFSAVYYPVSILPTWAKYISNIIPSTYIFEGLREILFTGRFSYDKLLISFALNGIYLALALWFFIFMFRKSRRLGLGRLI